MSATAPITLTSSIVHPRTTHRLLSFAKHAKKDCLMIYCKSKGNGSRHDLPTALVKVCDTHALLRLQNQGAEKILMEAKGYFAQVIFGKSYGQGISVERSTKIPGKPIKVFLHAYPKLHFKNDTDLFAKIRTLLEKEVEEEESPKKEVVRMSSMDTPLQLRIMERLSTEGSSPELFIKFVDEALVQKEALKPKTAHVQFMTMVDQARVEEMSSRPWSTSDRPVQTEMADEQSPLQFKKIVKDEALLGKVKQAMEELNRKSSEAGATSVKDATSESKLPWNASQVMAVAARTTSGRELIEERTWDRKRPESTQTFQKIETGRSEILLARTRSWSNTAHKGYSKLS